MNVNVYLEDALAKTLNRYSKEIGKSRNSIIREALKEWVAHHESKQWPKSILKFSGVSNFSPFESNRDELIPPKDDPFN